MKRIYISFLLLSFAACTNNNKSNDIPAVVADTIASMPADTTMAEVDGMSGATAVANKATFNGTLIIPPQQYATVTLAMPGAVRNTSLIPGAYVKKGEVLALLENPDFIDLQQTYLDSRAQTEFLEKEYQRQQSLAQQEAASQKKFQQSKADYLSMKSKMDAANVQLSLLGVSVEELSSKGIMPYIAVKAPISGYVANMQMNIGKHFCAGEPLCDIIDKSQPMLRLTAYEKDLPKLAVGDAVEFRVNGMGKDVFYGVVISIGQQVDDMNRSLEVYARVTKPDPQFRPGMYVSARIVQK